MDPSLRHSVLPRRGRCCDRCGAVFSAAQELVSVLIESTELARKDYCIGCFEQETHKTAWAQWQSQLPADTTEPVEPQAVDDRALELLRKSLPEGGAKPCVLAHYLHRRGLLQRVRPFSGRNWVFEVRQTGECLQVIEPDPQAMASLDLERDILAELSGGSESTDS